MPQCILSTAIQKGKSYSEQMEPKRKHKGNYIKCPKIIIQTKTSQIRQIRHFMLIKGIIYKEDSIITHMYSPNACASNFILQIHWI
jgi:hypothetical protein